MLLLAAAGWAGPDEEGVLVVEARAFPQIPMGAAPDQEEARILVAAGGVKLSYADLEVWAERAVVWVSPELLTGQASGDRPALEVYAEGTVTLVRGLARGRPGALPGDPRTEPTALVSFQAERAYIDVAGGTAVGVNAAARGVLEATGRIIPLHVRGEEVRLSQGTVWGEEVTLTTCSFAQPHWDFRPRRLLLRESATGRRMESASTRLDLLGRPILAFPYLVGDTGWGLGKRVPLRRIRAGETGEFGAYVQTEWGGDLVEDVVEWTLLADYYGKRGAGLGAGLDWNLLGEGMARGYYIHDSGESPNYPPPERNDRGEVRGWHRMPLGEHLRLDLEWDYQSDRTFLLEYDEQRAKEEKQGETDAYLRFRWSDVLAYGLARVRVNEWRTETERLPEAGLNLVETPLFGGAVYYDTTSAVGNLRRRFDNDLDLPPLRSVRADTRHTVGVPLALGPVRIDPFVGVWETVWERGALDRSSQDRFAAFFGARASTHFWRIFEVDLPALDIHRLRHVLTPDVTYWNLVDVDRSPSSLLQFDSVDSLEEQELIHLSLLNRIQTRSAMGKEEENRLDGRYRGSPVDVLYLEQTLDLYPHARRDRNGHVLGNSRTDLTARLTRWLTVLGESDLDVGEGELLTFSAGADLSADVGEHLDAFLGFRYREGEFANVVADTDLQLDGKWSLRAYAELDTHALRLSDARMTLTRQSHDHALHLKVAYDSGENDLGVHLSFTLRDLDPHGRRSYDPGSEPFLDLLDRSRAARRTTRPEGVGWNETEEEP